MRYKKFTAIFFLLTVITAYSQTASDNLHKVIIQVVDVNKQPMANTNFTILNQNTSVKEKGTTDSAGLYETYLLKGKGFLIKFAGFDPEITYNFRVPFTGRLKAYRVICRIPYEQEGEKKTAKSDDDQSTGEDVPTTIILQDKDYKQYENQEFTLTSKDKSFKERLKTDPSGVCDVLLKENQRYTIQANIAGIDYSDNFIVPEKVKNYTFRLILPSPTTPSGDTDVPTQIAREGKKTYLRTFSLENITFEFGSYELKPSSYPRLDSLVNELKNKPKMEIEIAGHTDDVGTDEDNLVLSKNRALSIYDYLIEKGVDPKRLTAEGYGEASPIATNKTAEGRALNRRIEVRVIKE